MRHIPALLLLGCASYNGGGKPPDCTEAASVIDGTEVTALGFSAADLIAEVGPSTRQPLTWFDAGSETTLTTSATWESGEVRFIDRKDTAGGTSAADTADDDACADSIEVDTNLTFATDDGVFAETWSVTVIAFNGVSATFSQDLDAVSLVGTFDKWDYADPTEEYESLGAEVHGTLAASGSGAVNLAGAGWEDPDCHETGCVAWESTELVARWGPY